ncbi:hypothetical protein PHYBOEH_006651 [Phytophthora boehmeriae]|uniref:Calmodulin-lysine N-methyltransferase n=1 Tax=Phytophthora boehmeriae TaxID=109152 RepID=A0A8T1WCY3_9STRA|nr:hypothetical protein PHYBOEH_006651 [Phytophthora boehmeriae]
MTLKTTAAATASTKTKRHWQVLRNALLRSTTASGSPSLSATESSSSATASSISTDFFPIFPALESKRTHSPPRPNFVWIEYALVSNATNQDKATGDQHTALKVYVHEKRKDVKRMSIAELQSHQVNEGVDNTGNIRTWPSEQILLSYLLSSPICSQVQRRDQRGELLPISCCELGGGMAGLASLGLLARAPVQLKRVLVTDGNPLSVKNLQLCVDENKAQQVVQAHTEIAAELLRWDRNASQRQDLQHQFDLVFASDCLFFEDFHEDLAHTIKSLLRGGSGRCLLFQPSRNQSMERFCAVAERYGFIVHRSEDYDPTIVRKHSDYQQTRPDYVPDVHFPVLLTLRIGDSHELGRF